MSSQIEHSIFNQTLTAPHKGGFICFCGEWFQTRDLFEEHLKQHPDKYVVCKDCGRVLPKGSWKVDNDGNFISVD